MNTKFLPYAKPFIEDDDIEAVAKALASGWLTMGPNVGSFEEELKQQTGARHAVVCSSGTAALHLAMLALGLGEGDAVVVPSLTFVATANVVRHVGAEVIFADVDRETGLMGPEHLEDALKRASGAKVKAVTPVHMCGQCLQPSLIAQVAERHGIHVVEDACHALGTTIDGTAVGSCAHSSMAAFSFAEISSIISSNSRSISYSCCQSG